MGKAIAAALKTDFTPLAIGVGATLEKVPVVFAGYGSRPMTRRSKLDYDDYAGIDVKGKAVLILRREPQQDDKASPFGGDRATTLFAHVPAQGDQRLPARCGRRSSSSTIRRRYARTRTSC